MNPDVHLDWATRTAGGIARRIVPPSYQEEYTQVALLAYVEACGRFDPGLSFDEGQSFFSKRMEGAVIDELRRRDPLTRRERRDRIRAGERGEVLDPIAPVPLEQMPPIQSEDSTEERALDLLVVEALLNSLKGRDREIVKMRYGEDMTLVEIGVALGVAESRIYQILSRILARHEATRLTKREVEVLELLAEGGRDQTIAVQLRISPLTVRTHIKHIAEKFESKSRAHSVSIGYRRGYLTLPEETDG